MAHRRGRYKAHAGGNQVSISPRQRDTNSARPYGGSVSAEKRRPPFTPAPGSCCRARRQRGAPGGIHGGQRRGSSETPSPSMPPPSRRRATATPAGGGAGKRRTSAAALRMGGRPRCGPAAHGFDTRTPPVLQSSHRVSSPRTRSPRRQHEGVLESLFSSWYDGCPRHPHLYSRLGGARGTTVTPPRPIEGPTSDLPSAHVRACSATPRPPPAVRSPHSPPEVRPIPDIETVGPSWLCGGMATERDRR